MVLPFTPGLGVRHRGVEAHLVMTPDGVVQVDGSLEIGRVGEGNRDRDPRGSSLGSGVGPPFSVEAR